MSTQDNSNEIRNDREAQFLASQQARLSKLHDGQSNEDDVNIQLQRKKFWQTFKFECSALHRRLSALIGEDEEEIETMTETETKTDKTLFVTAQQRNEALEKLQQIQMSILAVNHYTLRSTKFSTDEQAFLPEHFAHNEMPELPLADLRLLNAEVQSLKSRTQEVQQIIIPKEKFRFKRYHALMQEKKQFHSPIFEEDDDEVLSELKVDEDESNPVNENTHLAFAGLTLSDKKDCVIVVEANGTIIFKNFQNEIIDTVTPSNVLLEAKAFLIRNLINCRVQV